MKNGKHAAEFILSLLFALLMFSACERQNNKMAASTDTSWTNLLESTRVTILNGSWEQAENAWAKLYSDSRTEEHVQQWIELQVDILEKTKSDPLKAELRLGAIQQMYFETEVSRLHLAWLKKSVAEGLFPETQLRQKAQELLRVLEGDKMEAKPHD